MMPQNYICPLITKHRTKIIIPFYLIHGNNDKRKNILVIRKINLFSSENNLLFATSGSCSEEVPLVLG